MSRLGKTPISVPKGVEVKVSGGEVHVKGPKGTLTHTLEEGVTLRQVDEKVFIDVDEKKNISSAVHGLHRSLIANMIIGAHKGFEKKLSLIGVGYRAAVQGQVLDLQLGFSHPTQVKIPKSVQVAVEKSTMITITGADKHAVGQFASVVRSMKPPEPYKGKGIRYENEYVRKKAGKAAKGKTG